MAARMSHFPYHYIELSRPDLGLIRAPGPGLGNLLFPISRALIGQHTYGGTLVLPTMRQIKIGPYLRWERDKRTYGNIFRHRSLPELGHWLRARTLSQVSDRRNSHIVTYSGLGQQFHDIAGRRDLVRSFLTDRSTRRVPKLSYDVAIHVRLGDFAQADRVAEQQNTRVPLDWYDEALDEARRLLGLPMPRIMVFSDEDPQKVIIDMAVRNAEPEPPGNALTSILSIAQARLLIASRSTFSLWGQYLGQIPAIWPQGFQLGLYKPVDDTRDLFI